MSNTYIRRSIQNELKLVVESLRHQIQVRNYSGLSDGITGLIILLNNYNLIEETCSNNALIDLLVEKLSNSIQNIVDLSFDNGLLGIAWFESTYKELTKKRFPDIKLIEKRIEESQNNDIFNLNDTCFGLGLYKLQKWNNNHFSIGDIEFEMRKPSMVITRNSLESFINKRRYTDVFYPVIKLDYAMSILHFLVNIRNLTPIRYFNDKLISKYIDYLCVCVGCESQPEKILSIKYLLKSILRLTDIEIYRIDEIIRRRLEDRPKNICIFNLIKVIGSTSLVYGIDYSLNDLVLQKFELETYFKEFIPYSSITYRINNKEVQLSESLTAYGLGLIVLLKIFKEIN